MAAKDDMGAQAQAGAETPKAGKAKRVLLLIGAAVLAFSGYAGWGWYSHGRFHEETDDAYLQADLITLQARATGYVSELLIAPNAPVAKGQLIARIDPEDQLLALERARNTLASANSAVSQIEAQIVSNRAAIAQADASLAAAEATNDGAQKAYHRAKELKSSSAGTQAALDAAEATAKSAAAQVRMAQSAIAQSQAELSVLQARGESARLEIRAAQTAIRQAERDLEFTEIRAPFAGILTERQIEPGSFVTSGTRIGTLVPVADIYVEANFKETQIAEVKPGAEVLVTVDAWPDHPLRGRVESLTAGTGQVFSLLPSSNATGNFTKIVQRVPVRISIDDKDRALLPLRPGMSVIVSVDIRTGLDEEPAVSPQSPPAETPEAPAVSQREGGALKTLARSGG
ncbi:HlyD family secretion protein [Paracoccus ravus]|uniref:HlyD family secretion protein n=1 Tax=Paracoccus ravus TaxID=2447760 RepID=UPI001FD67391|nr:HlyD family secretion protein [Paracoccus ravus]